jgi:hypothetical protein
MGLILKKKRPAGAATPAGLVETLGLGNQSPLSR